MAQSSKHPAGEHHYEAAAHHHAAAHNRHPAEHHHAVGERAEGCTVIERKPKEKKLPAERLGDIQSEGLSVVLPEDLKAAKLLADEAIQKAKAKRRKAALPTTDEKLALEFLAGRVTDAGGVRHRYLDGEEETKARAAPLRLLRGGLPLDTAIGWRLAVLVDPSSDDERKFKIMRRQARETDCLVALGIARFIAHERAAREELESVKRAAEVRFGVSERPVDRAWA